MNVAPNPCSSCPYRKDTPSGVWDASEYAKLRGYDDPQESFATFLCHHSPFMEGETACRGWLTVHCESVAVRLMQLHGEVTKKQVYAEVAAPLYASGNEAADAGMRGVKRPGKKALAVIDKLVKRKRKKARK